LPEDPICENAAYQLIDGYFDGVNRSGTHDIAVRHTWAAEDNISDRRRKVTVISKAAVFRKSIGYVQSKIIRKKYLTNEKVSDKIILTNVS